MSGGEVAPPVGVVIGTGARGKSPTADLLFDLILLQRQHVFPGSCASKEYTPGRNNKENKEHHCLEHADFRNNH